MKEEREDKEQKILWQISELKKDINDLHMTRDKIFEISEKYLMGEDHGLNDYYQIFQIQDFIRGILNKKRVNIAELKGY